MHILYTVCCAWANPDRKHFSLQKVPLSYFMPFILNFFFPLPDIKTPQLKYGESPRKPTTSNLWDFLDPTDRNYFVELWAKLAARKTPVVRRGRRGKLQRSVTASDRKGI